MSNLYEAIEEIVEEMEKNVDDRMMLMYAKMIRIALKASGKPQENNNLFQMAALGVSPMNSEGMNRNMIENAKKEFANKSKDRVSLEEQFMGEMAVCLDGPEKDTNFPIDPAMPIGAHCKVAGKVYTLGADRQLHFNEQQTEQVESKILLGKA